VQLNHPGKQAPKGLNKETVAPSAVPFRADMKAFFATPRELKPAEVRALIQRYGKAAGIAPSLCAGGLSRHAQGRRPGLLHRHQAQFG
jgi:2,4-dienoyl-CoA reductase-like NADH-dependent reductase (Old Yellow Enzyme family)